MPSRNLILSSGGGLGAWQSGALQALADADPCEYECVAGNSVGAFNAAVLCQYPVSRTPEAVRTLSVMWRDATGRPLPSKARIMTSLVCCGSCASSALRASWLEELVEAVNWEAVERSDRVLFVGVHNVETEECEYHSSGPMCKHCARRHTGMELRKYVIASMSVPILFPAVDIEGTQYVDGGVSNIVPRCRFPTKRPVDVFVTYPSRWKAAMRSGNFAIPMRFYATFSTMFSCIVEDDIKWVTDEYQARVLRPQKLLAQDINMLSFTREKAMKMFRNGYAEISAKMPVKL